MASSIFLLLLVLPIAFPMFSRTSIFANGDEALVEKICKATPYPDLCMSIVKAGPPGSQGDAKAIASLVVKAITLKNKETLQFLLKQPVDQDPSWDLVVMVCRQEYGVSQKALEMAENMDPNVAKDVMDAMSSLAYCRQKFEVESGPRELPAMQELIEHLLAIALKIFEFL